MIAFQNSHFQRDVILWPVRCYVAYSISYRPLKKMMAEHGVEVDQTTLQSQDRQIGLVVGKGIQARKQPVGSSWRIDET